LFGLPACSLTSLVRSLRSLHQLAVTRLPASVEGRFLRSIDAEVDEPTFTRNGLDPLTFFASRGLWAKEKVNGLVFGRGLFIERAQRRPVLIRLNLRTGLGVINRDGPEQLSRHRHGDVELVGLAAVEVGPALVARP